MSQNVVGLQQADRVEIITIVDNYSDVLLPGSENVFRPPLAPKGEIPADTLLAEHGLSLFIRVHRENETHSFILDSGYSNVAVPHNIKYLGLDLGEVEAVILSHGHMDHTGSLKEILALTGKGTELIVHPDAFSARILQAEGNNLVFPEFPSREKLAGWGALVRENRGPLLLGNGSLLITGEVKRYTSFEKGMPGARIMEDGQFVTDTFKDDQALVADLGPEGLVIVSGCAHSGIMNSIQYARRLTGQEKICAVIGGFHLSGIAMQASVEPTVEAMKKLDLKLISPMHCTGFRTAARFARELPDAFVLNSVGTRIEL
jgi:7,8-dihydropterin-6-yl-methyl-4-(beta-D-ribofuranosyl)aminobenzene 5'-phosphate synthase